MAFEWRLRHLMARRGLFKIGDLQQPLAEEGFPLSTSQVHRLVTKKPSMVRPEMLSALLRILDCTFEELMLEVSDQPSEPPHEQPTRRAANRAVPSPPVVDLQSRR